MAGQTLAGVVEQAVVPHIAAVHPAAVQSGETVVVMQVVAGVPGAGPHNRFEQAAAAQDAGQQTVAEHATALDPPKFIPGRGSQMPCKF